MPNRSISCVFSRRPVDVSRDLFSLRPPFSIFFLYSLLTPFLLMLAMCVVRLVPWASMHTSFMVEFLSALFIYRFRHDAIEMCFFSHFLLLARELKNERVVRAVSVKWHRARPICTRHPIAGQKPTAANAFWFLFDFFFLRKRVLDIFFFKEPNIRQLPSLAVNCSLSHSSTSANDESSKWRDERERDLLDLCVIEKDVMKWKLVPFYTLNPPQLKPAEFSLSTRKK